MAVVCGVVVFGSRGVFVVVVFCGGGGVVVVVVGGGGGGGGDGDGVVVVYLWCYFCCCCCLLNRGFVVNDCEPKQHGDNASIYLINIVVIFQRLGNEVCKCVTILPTSDIIRFGKTRRINMKCYHFCSK